MTGWDSTAFWRAISVRRCWNKTIVKMNGRMQNTSDCGILLFSAHRMPSEMEPGQQYKKKLDHGLYGNRQKDRRKGQDV